MYIHLAMAELRVSKPNRTRKYQKSSS